MAPADRGPATATGGVTTTLSEWRGAAVYSVEAVANPGIAPRLLNFFAQQNLIPADVHVRRCGDGLRIRIAQPQVAEGAAAIIAEKIRSLVLVRSVGLDYRHAG